jgi:hypothetical protein
MPFLWQGIWWCDAIIGLKAEAPVKGRIAEYVDLVRAGILQPSQARADNCAAIALPLPGRGDSERSQERDVVSSSDNAACREDDMPHQSLIDNPDKRENNWFFS